METISINRVEIRGRIGQDPKFSTISGKQMARFSVATNERYKDRSGELKEETTWHNVSVWESKTTGDLHQLAKGRIVHVVGRIRNSRYKTADGTDRYYNEISAIQMTVHNEEDKQFAQVP